MFVFVILIINILNFLQGNFFMLEVLNPNRFHCVCPYCKFAIFGNKVYCDIRQTTAYYATDWRYSVRGSVYIFSIFGKGLSLEVDENTGNLVEFMNKNL